jgi:hypothetical protein
MEPEVHTYTRIDRQHRVTYIIHSDVPLTNEDIILRIQAFNRMQRKPSRKGSWVIINPHIGA